MRKQIITLAVAALLGTTALYGQISIHDYDFAAGLRTGLNLGNMRLTDESYDVYEHHLSGGIIAGGYFQWRTPFGLSLVPEIGYVTRRAFLEWEDVKYRQRVHSLDIRLGVRYNFDIYGTPFSPYVVAGPVWGIALGGRVDYYDDVSGNIRMQMSSRNMRTHDVGMLCGAGFDYPFFIEDVEFNVSAEIGYTWEFVNSFTQSERDASGNVLNRYYDTHANEGKRLTRGLEFSVRIGMPF